MNSKIFLKTKIKTIAKKKYLIMDAKSIQIILLCIRFKKCRIVGTGKLTEQIENQKKIVIY
jgi:hypothetical protein